MLESFISDNEGKFLDYDQSGSAECVDVAKRWADICRKPKVTGNGIDWAKAPGYPWVAYRELLWPSPGDIVVWGKGIGPYGHVAVVVAAGPTAFESFDQNYPLKTPCHLQQHTYKDVLGWNIMEGVVTELQTDVIKVDGAEELFLNRELNSGDENAIVGRAKILADKILSGKSHHEAIGELVDDIIRNAQGDDRQRLRDKFTYWLTLIP